MLIDEMLTRWNADDQIIGKELCVRIVNSRTWREALHYKGQAVRLGRINVRVAELDNLTPADCYKAVDQMLNSCMWTNGNYVVWSIDGKVQGLSGKLAADLEDEGWRRVVDAVEELGISPRAANETMVRGYVTIKELQDD